MPTQRLFDECPDFPSDVPVAYTPRISLNELEGGGTHVSTRLYQASREYGYFLLDLTNSARGIKLLDAAELIFDVATKIFDLGSDVLDAYKLNLPKDLQGYKRAGAVKTDHGKQDAIEFYTINQDDLTGLAPAREKPDLLVGRINDCRNLVRQAHEVVTIILKTLDKELDLPIGTLASLCSMEKPSATSLRLTRSRPLYDTDESRDSQIKLGGHTDIGAATILFNVVGGLQILPKGVENINENWRYIKPEPDCVLFQIGDTMVEWTGGLLKSNLHRVYHPPGVQANITRQSMAYLIRPSNDASMHRLSVGSTIPPLAQGEEEETRSPTEWATWRNSQIMNGKLKPSTKGGIQYARTLQTAV